MSDTLIMPGIRRIREAGDVVAPAGAGDDGKIVSYDHGADKYTLVPQSEGVTDHADLDSLDYASSGHTGFEPAGAGAAAVTAHVALGDPHTQYLLESGYTAADVLAKLLTVDVDGSGLNATTLQSTTPSAYGLSLLDDVDAATARATLGLGTAATANTGTSAGNVVVLDGSAKLPAVDGSQLTNLPAPSGILLATGATTGATSQAQTFTNGTVQAKISVPSNSTNAFGLYRANGSTQDLYYDSTNGRFGFGASSPASVIHALGNNTASVGTFVQPISSTSIGSGFAALELTNTNQTNGNWTHIAFTDAVGGSFCATISSSTINHASNYGSIVISTNGPSGLLPRLTVTETGRVGIRQTAPASVLEVVADNTLSAATFVQPVSSTSFTSGYAGFEMVNTDLTNGNWAHFGFADVVGGNFSAAISCCYINHSLDYGQLHFTTRGADGYQRRVTIDEAGNVGMGTTAPATLLDVAGAGSNTNTVTTVTTLRHSTSGTPAAGYGLALRAQLESSTTESQDAGRLTWQWDVATHASRASKGQLSAYYTTTERPAITWGADSSVALLSFYDVTTPIAKPTSGANLTNNVTSGGTDNQIDNWTDLTTYATDAAAIRNAIYQLARKQKQINDGLRALGLFT